MARLGMAKEFGMTDSPQIEVEYEVKWKRPSKRKVPAQVAHHEIERLRRETGELALADLVKASEPVSAPLHPEFEWRNDIAAHKYRLAQAKKLVEELVVIEVKKSPREQSSFDIVDGIGDSERKFPRRPPPQKNLAIRRAVVELELWCERHSKMPDLHAAIVLVRSAINAALENLDTIHRDAS